MSLRITHTRILTQSKQWLDEALTTQLLALIGACFDGVSAEQYLHKYFLADQLIERKLKLYYQHDKLVGYCLLTFTNLVLDKKSIVCVGASAGFYPEFRRGGNTVTFSIKTALYYWLTHPWKRVFYADTMLSPAMYRAVAKKVAIIYPHPDCSMTAEIRLLMKQLKSKFSVEQAVKTENSETESFVCSVGRKTNYSTSEVELFRQSEKTEIRYFCKVNPKFDQGYALIAVVPVNLSQLFGLVVKFFRARLKRDNADL